MDWLCSAETILAAGKPDWSWLLEWDNDMQARLWSVPRPPPVSPYPAAAPRPPTGRGGSSCPDCCRPTVSRWVRGGAGRAGRGSYLSVGYTGLESNSNYRRSGCGSTSRRSREQNKVWLIPKYRRESLNLVIIDTARHVRPQGRVCVTSHRPRLSRHLSCRAPPTRAFRSCQASRRHHRDN